MKLVVPPLAMRALTHSFIDSTLGLLCTSDISDLPRIPLRKIFSFGENWPSQSFRSTVQCFRRKSVFRQSEIDFVSILVLKHDLRKPICFAGCLLLLKVPLICRKSNKPNSMMGSGSTSLLHNCTRKERGQLVWLQSFLYWLKYL